MDAVLITTSNPRISGSRFQIRHLSGYRHLPCRVLCSRTLNQPFIVKSSLNAPNKETKLSNLKPHVDHFKEKLWKTFPESAKKFPWKEAPEMVSQRLLFHGKKALKLFLLIVFIASSMSDVALSISRDRELLIPLGLYLGCILADFFKETSQDLFQVTEVRDMLGILVGVGSFFAAMKLASLFMATGGRLLLSHICSGGLMQVLWMGKKLKEAEGSKSGNASPPELTTECHN